MPDISVAPVKDDPLWTMDQLAGFLQVKIQTIRNWRVNGTGPRGYRVGKYVRFKRSEVMDWLNAQ